MTKEKVVFEKDQLSEVEFQKICEILRLAIKEVSGVSAVSNTTFDVERDNSPEVQRIAPAREGAVNEIIRDEVHNRRKKGDLWAQGPMPEIAWDMMLGLYETHLNGQPASVSTLMYSTASPNTTALRWVRVLEQRGWITSSPSNFDGRKTIVAMTVEGHKVIESWLNWRKDRWVKMAW